MFLCRIARCRANVAIRIDAETNLPERGNETLLYVAGNKKFVRGINYTATTKFDWKCACISYFVQSYVTNIIVHPIRTLKIHLVFSNSTGQKIHLQRTPPYQVILNTVLVKNRVCGKLTDDLSDDPACERLSHRCHKSTVSRPCEFSRESADCSSW